jgi:hypothetical protein
MKMSFPVIVAELNDEKDTMPSDGAITVVIS